MTGRPGECDGGHRGSRSACSTGPLNAFTVDVEDYFQVLAFEPVIPRSSWATRELRVGPNVDRILDLLARRSVRGTFFVLSWVAEREPAIVRKIAAAGHEIASHGCLHQRVTELSPAQFAADVRHCKQVLEDQSGQQVLGYRAPSYSINASNLWAHDVLQQEGYTYSSSVFPGRHDLYGMPEAPRFPFRSRPGSLLELPITTVEALGVRMSAAGGGFFRLWPYPVFRSAVRRVNREDGQPAIFYMHPWEIDEHQPRVADAPLRSRFRHYLNLDRVMPRLERLLSDFRWARMDEVFDLRPA